MRPASEMRHALLRAAHDLVAERGVPGRGATLHELTTRSCVGRAVARNLVSNMKRGGALQIVGERVVDYRNRPVAEYAPAQAPAEHASLNDVFLAWSR